MESSTELPRIALVFQLPAAPLPDAPCFAIRIDRGGPRPHVDSLPDVNTPDVHTAMVAALNEYTHKPEVYSECFTDDELRSLKTMQVVFAYKPLVDQATLQLALERDGYVVTRLGTGSESSSPARSPIEKLAHHLALTSPAAVRASLPFHAWRVGEVVGAGLIATPPEADRFISDIESASQAWSEPMKEAFRAIVARSLMNRFGPSSEARPTKDHPPAPTPSADLREHLLAWTTWLAAAPPAKELNVRWNERFVARALVTGAIDTVGAAGVTPLWHAAYFGMVELVAKLLAAGARLDAHDGDRTDVGPDDTSVVSHWRGGLPDPGHPTPTGPSTVLHAAVSHRVDAKIVRMLLDHGVPVTARDRYGDTPLHLAVAAHVPDEVLTLLLDRGADPNAIDGWGRMPIDFADLDRAKLLLARGADPNGGPGTKWRASDEWSIVTQHAYAGDAPFLELLFATGADPKRHPEALPLACLHGQTDAIRVLLAHGAAQGTTEWIHRQRGPLACAATRGSLELVKLVYAQCKGPLDDALCAAIEGATRKRETERITLVKWLLDRGADPSAAIGEAAQQEDIAYVRLLLDRGARVDVTDARFGLSPLFWAVSRERFETLELLLARGSDPTPALWRAAKCEDEAYVRALLEGGARVDVVDDAGEQSLIHAARAGHHRVVRLLLEKGADPHARAADGKTAYEIAEHAYREDKSDDAGLVLDALAEVGAGPPRPAAAPPAPQPVAAPPARRAPRPRAPQPPAAPTAPPGLKSGERVTHPKFGEGSIVAAAGEKLTIAFDTAGTKVLLSKFVVPVGG